MQALSTWMIGVLLALTIVADFSFGIPRYPKLWLILWSTVIVFAVLFPHYEVATDWQLMGGTNCMPLLDNGSPSFTQAIADSIQVPLGLKWYDVQLTNISRPPLGYKWDPDPTTHPTNGAIGFRLPINNPRISHLLIPEIPLFPGTTTTEKAVPVNGTMSFTYSIDQAQAPTCFDLGFSSSGWSLQRIATSGIPDSLGTADSEFRIVASPNLIGRLTKLVLLFFFFTLFIPALWDEVLAPVVKLLKKTRRCSDSS